MKLSSSRCAWRPHVVAVLLLVCTALTASAQTPTLGELARKEQERRKSLPSATKVITNKDLPKAKTPAPAPAAEPATTPGQADDPKKDSASKEQEQKEPKDEAYWRGRMAAAREDLRRAEIFRDALQSRINALSTDFVNRDDPYQRALIAEDRQKAMAEMERVKGDIGKASQAIADIEEEARQAGVPPGWIR